MKREKYYVYNPSKSKPAYVHKKFDDALKEAKRLARKENDDFEVLQIVSVVGPVKRFEVQHLRHKLNIFDWFSVIGIFGLLTMGIWKLLEVINSIAG